MAERQSESYPRHARGRVPVRVDRGLCLDPLAVSRRT
jgi:hypothetical protein